MCLDWVRHQPALAELPPPAEPLTAPPPPVTLEKELVPVAARAVTDLATDAGVATEL